MAWHERALDAVKSPMIALKLATSIISSTQSTTMTLDYRQQFTVHDTDGFTQKATDAV